MSLAAATTLSSRSAPHLRRSASCSIRAAVILGSTRSMLTSAIQFACRPPLAIVKLSVSISFVTVLFCTCADNVLPFPVDQDASSTYELLPDIDFNITYLDGRNIQGSYFNDTVHIGDASVRNQQLGLALESVRPTGIMGLGFSSNVAASRQYPTIVDNLVSQGFINAPVYSLYLVSDISFDFSGETNGLTFISRTTFPQMLATSSSAESTPRNLLGSWRLFLWYPIQVVDPVETTSHPSMCKSTASTFKIRMGNALLICKISTHTPSSTLAQPSVSCRTTKSSRFGTSLASLLLIKCLLPLSTVPTLAIKVTAMSSSFASPTRPSRFL
jgi:hypothetical protein